MTSKKGQGRREFLRTTGMVAGGVLLSQQLSSAQAAQGGLPLETRLIDFPLLTEEEKAKFTPTAAELTKGDLICLSRVSSNREEPTQALGQSLTLEDINSIEEAFADFGVDRFQSSQAKSLGSVSCCCTCTPCCSCCGASVVEPVQMLSRSAHLPAKRVD